MKKSAFCATVFALLLTACVQPNQSQIQQLNAQIAEKDLAIKLSAQHSAELEKQYTDMYLPPDSVPAVAIGDSIKASSTILAQLPAHPTQAA